MPQDIRIADIQNDADRNFFMLITQLSNEHIKNNGTQPRYLFVGHAEWECYVKFAEHNWMVSPKLHYQNNRINGLLIIPVGRPNFMHVSG